MQRGLRVLRLGIVRYTEALELQTKIQQSLISNPLEPHTLLLLQHPPTYTAGRRDAEDNPSRFASLGAEYHKTSRGGLITFHGPGQLIAYPIMNLAVLSLSTRQYIHSLEQTLMDYCKICKLDTARTEHPGVWVGDNKIAAIGVSINQHVSMHGVALNCSTDLTWYNHIVPCGLADKGVTSLSKEIGRTVTVDEVIPGFIERFQEEFKLTLVK